MSEETGNAMAVDAPPPNATIYIRNLPEKLSLDDLRTQLTEIFEDMGTIHQIRISKNIRLRGQAFINFDNETEAGEAIEMMNGFDFHGQPLSVTYAKEKSDRVVLATEGQAAFEAHKQRRLARKEETNKFWEDKLSANAASAKTGYQEGSRRAKRAAAKGEEVVGAARPNKMAKGASLADDFLPPNKTLLVRDIPVEYPADGLKLFFSRFPGFKEIRTTAARKGVAFVEYESAEQSAAARESLNGIEVGRGKIRVTFQKT